MNATNHALTCARELLGHERDETLRNQHALNRSLWSVYQEADKADRPIVRDYIAGHYPDWPGLEEVKVGSVFVCRDDMDRRFFVVTKRTPCYVTVRELANLHADREQNECLQPMPDTDEHWRTYTTERRDLHFPFPPRSEATAHGYVLRVSNQFDKRRGWYRAADAPLRRKIQYYETGEPHFDVDQWRWARLWDGRTWIDEVEDDPGLPALASTCSSLQGVSP